MYAPADAPKNFTSCPVSSTPTVNAPIAVSAAVAKVPPATVKAPVEWVIFMLALSKLIMPEAPMCKSLNPRDAVPRSRPASAMGYNEVASRVNSAVLFILKSISLAVPKSIAVSASSPSIKSVA